MLVGFRTDASLEIGSGHVMRCLALADGLRESKARVIFFCRPYVGHLIHLIRQRGYDVAVVQVPADTDGMFSASAIQPPWPGTDDWEVDAASTCELIGQLHLDWMVVDHYALDQKWERAIRHFTKHLMVIDDLANRPHQCDMLLDQNLGRSVSDYRGLVGDDTTMLVGPRFALLRAEFARWRARSLLRRARPNLRRILISMGGVDNDNFTGKILEVLESCKLAKDLEITVVMGGQSPWLNAVKKRTISMNMPVKVLVGVSDMARIMTESDLSIGAAGGTAWERCCLGLPSLLFVLAENQRPGAVALQNSGSALVIENFEFIDSILNKLNRLEDGPDSLRGLSGASSRIVDGGGVTRICESLMSGYV